MVLCAACNGSTWPGVVFILRIYYSDAQTHRFSPQPGQTRRSPILIRHAAVAPHHHFISVYLVGNLLSFVLRRCSQNWSSSLIQHSKCVKIFMYKNISPFPKLGPIRSSMLVWISFYRNVRRSCIHYWRMQTMFQTSGPEGESFFPFPQN